MVWHRIRKAKIKMIRLQQNIGLGRPVDSNEKIPKLSGFHNSEDVTLKNSLTGEEESSIQDADMTPVEDGDTEETNNIQGQHRADGGSFQNLNRKDLEEETGSHDVDMAVEQDVKVEDGDGNFLILDRKIPSKEEKTLQEESTKKHSLGDDGKGGENYTSDDQKVPFAETKNSETLGSETMDSEQVDQDNDDQDILPTTNALHCEAFDDETMDSEKVDHCGGDQKVTPPVTNPIRGEDAIDKTMGSEKVDHCDGDQKVAHAVASPIRTEDSVNETTGSQRIDQCSGDRKVAPTTSSILDQVSIDETRNSSKVDQYNKATGGKSGKESEEKRTNKNDVDTPCAEKVVTMLDCNQEQDSDKKEKGCCEDAAVETKEAPRLSQDKNITDMDSEEKKQKNLESDQKLPVDDKRGNAPSPSPSFAAIGFHGLSLQDGSSSYPFDGRWEMIWKLHPANRTAFTVDKHTLKMFDHSCELILLESPSGRCLSLQWPEEVTSAAIPVFQQSQLGISLGAPTIEWTTSDPQYGDITWKRLDSTGCKAEAVGEQSSDLVPLYPLDGNWALTWKSFYLDPSIIVVNKHEFKLFGCSCQLKYEPTDNSCPSFRWPLTVTSFKTPVFQKCKISIPLDMNITDWPNTVEWTITDKQYGEATWTRLNSEASEPSDISVRKRKTPDTEDSESIKKRKDEEELRMKSSIPGKAWDLVSGAMILSSQITEVNTIAEDDMIYLAERLLMAQADFKSRNINWKVDIVYHHTEEANLGSIRTNGLLSRIERQERNVHSRSFNGVACGEGIYCSEDPVRYANQRYGDTTILLARMKGVEGRHRSNDCDTSVQHGFCVIKSCNQCIPLFQFPAKLLGSCRRYRDLTENDVVHFREKLAVFQQSVQALLDQILNEGAPTEVNITWATCHNVDDAQAKRYLQHQAQRQASRRKCLQNRVPFNPVQTVTSHITVKYIENCNSTTELQRIIRENKTPQLFEAAKKRLMTVSPRSYSDFLSTQRTQYASSVQQNLQLVQQNAQLVQQNLQSIHTSFPPSLPPVLPKPFAPGQNAQNFANTINPEVVLYTAPDSLARTDEKDFCRPCLTHKQLVAGCPMCNDPLTTKGKVVQIAKCGHIFHSECLKKSMESQPHCPVCSVPISSNHWRGKMPSGSMTTSQVQSRCNGFRDFGTIVITYVIPSGFQKKYHPNPGLPFNSPGFFTAYIPAAPEGKKLIQRLKFAFSRGLTFKVGTCNSIVWGITHKSSQGRDASYISRCNIELDLLNVPTALELSVKSNAFGATATSHNGVSSGPDKANLDRKLRDLQLQEKQIRKELWRIAKELNQPTTFVNKGQGPTLASQATLEEIKKQRERIVAMLAQSANVGMKPASMATQVSTAFAIGNASAAQQTAKQAQAVGSTTNSFPIATSAGSNNANRGVGYASFFQQGSSFPVTWQSNADLPDRRNVIYNILQILQTMTPDKSAIMQRLPRMANNLEEHLYRSASSKAAYMDTFTLKFRLQQLGVGAFAKNG